MSEWLEMDGGAFRLWQGDCLELLRELPDASVDALVTDPPAGVSFMNATWDHDKGGRDAWIAWLSEVMGECRRVLKPGAHGLVWALPRTSHWTGMALENAGFEVRDCLQHLFGSGFPKSADVSKAIDAELGATRPVVEMRPQAGAKFPQAATLIDNGGFNDPERTEFAVTAPATPEAQAWDGWGTALKPGAEFWWLVRKSLAEKNVARNVLRHGCGGVNVGACRIGTAGERPLRVGQGEGRGEGYGPISGGSRAVGATSAGRWPANVVLSHTPACELAGTRRVRNPGGVPDGDSEKASRPLFTSAARTSTVHHFDPDGLETVEDWRCAEGCPVRLLDEQSGERPGGTPGLLRRGATTGRGLGYGANSPEQNALVGYGDTGGASRFYYCAKPSQAERSAGLEERAARNVNDGRATSIDNPFQRGDTERRNTHPTVKSRDLMAWLLRLVTPPGGVALDPFMGSGSTALACLDEGFRFVGFEKEPEYFEIARLRLAYWLRLARQQPSLF